jgi:hypothetical protein
MMDSDLLSFNRNEKRMLPILYAFPPPPPFETLLRGPAILSCSKTSESEEEM